MNKTEKTLALLQGAFNGQLIVKNQRTTLNNIAPFMVTVFKVGGQLFRKWCEENELNYTYKGGSTYAVIEHLYERDLFDLGSGDILILMDGRRATVNRKILSRSVEVTIEETGEVRNLHAWAIKRVYLKAANIPKAHTDEHREPNKRVGPWRIQGISRRRLSRIYKTLNPANSVAQLRY